MTVSESQCLKKKFFNTSQQIVVDGTDVEANVNAKSLDVRSSMQKNPNNIDRHRVPLAVERAESFNISSQFAIV